MTPWLVSRRFDLGVFLLPAVIALLLVPLGPWIAPSGETPFPMWIVCVVLIDVAHVWATLYRTYLDRDELARRPLLYTATPIVAFLFSLVLSAISLETFWTGLAYLAVFHFVRQQYGWVALYNKRDPAITRLDRAIDSFAIYSATLFPILWWHAHLPRSFEWFVPGDFIRELVSPALVDLLFPIYFAALAAFSLRQLQRRPLRIGKIIIVATTALCWGVGIIATDTDWAFTVTNVVIHGVPYFGFVWIEWRRKRPQAAFLPFYALLALLASGEELGWYGILRVSSLPLLIALLALPQVTHYLLDGFIWKFHRLSLAEKKI